MGKEEIIYITEFNDWQKNINELLDVSDFSQLLPKNKPVLLKPNVVNCDAPPITTPVQLIEAIVDYIQIHNPNNEIIVAEGCGSIEFETHTPFEKLGFIEMANRRNVKLIDLNHEETTNLINPECKRWPEIHLPKVILDSYLVSVPVLKAHSLTDVTITMKNMIGTAPPKYYNAGSWKKSAFHQNSHEAIFDLNRYRCPDFTILDATIGMSEAHLWGAHCNPPVNKIAVGKDPVAIDSYGCNLLNKNWKYVEYIKMANGIIGSAIYKEFYV
jgi:uncharacterized protein (DUF362 family)